MTAVSKSAHFVCLSNQTHLTHFISLFVVTPRQEIGVSNDIKTCSVREAQTGLVYTFMLPQVCFLPSYVIKLSLWRLEGNEDEIKSTMGNESVDLFICKN